MRKKSKVYLGIFLSAAMLMGTCPVEAEEASIFSDGEEFSDLREMEMETDTDTQEIDSNEQDVFVDGNVESARSYPWDDELNENYSYRYNSDGTVRITSYIGHEQDVVIPEEIDGGEVVEIESGAFLGTDITSIQLPDSIKKIESETFRNCYNLREIYMPAVTEIGSCAFYRCDNLKKIDLSKITKLKENALAKSGIEEAYLPKLKTKKLKGTFLECENLKSVSLPLVTNIESETFYACCNLVTIDLPMVTSVGENAFAECSSLKNINIPNLSEIGEKAFLNCTSIEKINLKNAQNIEMKAFNGCEKLSSVEFGKNLKFIGDYAFGACESYKLIILPDSKTLKFGVDILGLEVYYGAQKCIHCGVGSKAHRYAIKECINFTLHEYKNDTIKPATENESGEIVSVCDICGEETVKEKIPKLMDFFVNSDITYNGKVQKPDIMVADVNGDDVSPEYYDIVYNEDAIEPGEYTVTLNFKGKYSGTKVLKYYIKDDVAKIKASNMNVNLGSKKLNVKVTGDYNGLSYKSSNSKIVSVSADGKITAKKIGTAVITITAGATDRHEAVTKDITVKVIPQKTKLISVTKAGNGKLKLIWKTVPGVDGYVIYRDADKVKTIKGNTISSYTDSSLANGTRYDYEVRTYKKVNGKVYYSNYSNTKIATTAVVNVNYEGSYKSSSGELAIYKEGYKYDYVATVSLTRLCTLERLRGNKVNGHLEFAGYDPSGNIIYGTIKKSGNKVTFKITDTTWIYFDDGDTYIFYE